MSASVLWHVCPPTRPGRTTEIIVATHAHFSSQPGCMRPAQPHGLGWRPERRARLEAQGCTGADTPGRDLAWDKRSLPGASRGAAWSTCAPHVLSSQHQHQRPATTPVPRRITAPDPPFSPAHLSCRFPDLRLSAAVLDRFETAVLEMDESKIASACPLLAPLGLAPQGQELYLGFARRKLEQELGAGVDDAAPATQRLPSIYNVSAAFLRRWAGVERWRRWIGGIGRVV